MKLSIITYSLCLSVFMATSLPSVGSAQITVKPRVKSKLPSRRINTGVVVQRLMWANSTRNSYSKPACSPISIELKASGGKSPVTIDFNAISLSGTWWKIEKQGNRTFLKHPGGPPHGITFPIKATDANGTEITKIIHVAVTPYVKPVHISSVTYSSSTANQSFWNVAVSADYSIFYNNGFQYSFACGPHGQSVSYKNMEFIAEYQNGYKYKADLKFVPDINKGNVVKFYAKYDGGQSNKVTVNLPKRTAKYKESFKHKGILSRKPLKGNDTIKLGNLGKGFTACGKEYLTYEKAYISEKSSPQMGIPSGMYGAVVYGHPLKGKVIDQHNGKIRASWYHKGFGINYTATVDAQRRQGICNNNKR